MKSRRIISVLRWLRVVWLALFGVGLASVAYSYSRPIGTWFVRGDLYGLQLDHGDLFLFRGQHTGANDPSVRGTWMPWDASEATDQGNFVQPDLYRPADLIRPMTPKEWPPFLNVASGGYTWTRDDGTGTLTYDNWGRWLDVRSGQAWIVLAVASLPLVLPWITAARHKTKEGACTVCGYDLRATPARCPECGVPPAARNLEGVTP